MPRLTKRVKIMIGSESAVITHRQLTDDQIEMISWAMISAEKDIQAEKKITDMTARERNALYRRTYEVFSTISKIIPYSIDESEWEGVRVEQCADDITEHYPMWAVAIGRYFASLIRPATAPERDPEAQTQQDPTE